MLPVDHTFVLNLDRRDDRWRRTHAQFTAAGIPVTRFPAVDGARPEFREHYWTTAAIRTTFRTPGALACLLSHINILQCAQLNGYKRIAVFEDDVLLHKNFGAELQRLERLPPWRIVYLGATQVRWHDIVENVVPGFYRPNNTCGTWAMLLDSSVFATILRVYRQFGCTADLGLVSLFSNDPQAFVASPNMCICDVGDSDIRTTSLAHLPQQARWDPTCYTSPNAFIASG